MRTLLQGVVGNLAVEGVLPTYVKVFSPPFIPVATAAKLVREYYPVCPTVVDFMYSNGSTKIASTSYSFDEINLPPNFDFSPFVPDKRAVVHE